jgi:hypothetical protein
MAQCLWENRTLRRSFKLMKSATLHRDPQRSEGFQHRSIKVGAKNGNACSEMANGSGIHHTAMEIKFSLSVPSERISGLQVNSWVKSCQDAKHILPDYSSCHKIRLVKLAVRPPLKYDSAQ